MQLIPIGVYGRCPCVEGGCSSYLVSNDEGTVNVLIDCGTASLIELQRHVALENLDAIVLSHLHYDHMSDLFAVAYQYMRLNKKVDLYLPREPYAVYDSLSTAAFNKKGNPTKIDIKGIKLEFIPTIHPKYNSIPTNMIKIVGNAKTLLYTADFADIESYVKAVKNVDIVIGDACVITQDSGGNLPHVSVMELASATPTYAQLLLSHLSYNEEQAILTQARRYHPSARLAVIGEVIKF